VAAVTPDHKLADVRPVGGGYWSWTCTCGRSGDCGPALPTTGLKLAKRQQWQHAWRERRRGH